MAKAQTQYVCQSCGALHRKWQGRCVDCGEWNCIIAEGSARSEAPRGLGAKKGRIIELRTLASSGDNGARLSTTIEELDRVIGGGLVPGSVLLIGGDPGIGKSTLLLQATAGMAEAGGRCVYVSGEEALAQVAMRATRLGHPGVAIEFAAETNLRDILTTLEGGEPPAVVVIDSIQTMYVDSVDAAPGTVSQVRAATQELVRYAKSSGVAVMIVGHVTKSGQIAGPRVMEHMVDTVLYFEGDRGHQFRIVRTVKNRFGATDEIGVFEMTSAGLREIPNPSSLFLGDRDDEAPGIAVFAGLEGTRPVLVELQALVAPSPAANPRRAVVGWDSGRLAMILAVLDARAGLGLAASDVYLNVAGGLKIAEPGADLAAAAALISSICGKPLPPDTVIFGEISLSGRVRTVAQADQRLKEAQKLGFKGALVPKGTKSPQSGLNIGFIDKVGELIDIFDGIEPIRVRTLDKGEAIG